MLMLIEPIDIGIVIAIIDLFQKGIECGAKRDDLDDYNLKVDRN